jgi:hypothetical protein
MQSSTLSFYRTFGVVVFVPVVPFGLMTFGLVTFGLGIGYSFGRVTCGLGFTSGTMFGFRLGKVEFGETLGVAGFGFGTCPEFVFGVAEGF